MTQVSDRIKGIHKEGKLVNYKDSNSSTGVTQYSCSTHIRKKKLLVKGEWNNPQSNSRRALLVFFDSKTGEVKGLLVMCIP